MKINKEKYTIDFKHRDGFFEMDASDNKEGWNRLCICIFYPQIYINHTKTDAWLGEKRKTLFNITAKTDIGFTAEYDSKDKIDGWYLTFKLLGLGFSVYRQYGY